MKENEQSKFVRWGIPGWILFLALIMFIVIDILFTKDSSTNKLLTFFVGFSSNLGLSSSAATGLIGLFIAAAGIPLGFLIYQIYFFIRWNSPFSANGYLPPFVVGRWADLKKTRKGITNKQLSIATGIPEQDYDACEFTVNHGLIWRTVENILLQIYQNPDEPDSGSIQYFRDRYLTDILHILGSAMFAMYIGFIGYLLIKAKVYQFSFTLLFLIAFFFLGGLIYLLEVNEMESDNEIPHFLRKIKNINKILPKNLYIYYMFFIGGFLLLGSPSISTDSILASRIIFKGVSLLLVAIVYVSTLNNTSWRRILYELGIFIIIGIIAYYLTLWFIPRIPVGGWMFGWSVYAFYFGNIIFIKNRQNTRDDLIFMQNLLLRKHFGFTSTVITTGKQSYEEGI